MRKLEPQMVNSDKVSLLTFPLLSLPGVINLLIFRCISARIHRP